MRILTSKEEEFCSYAGIFGCLLTAAATIQHIVCYNISDHLLPMVMLVFYLLSFTSYLALALQKWFAPVGLLVSTILCLLNAAMALAGPLLSLLVLIHFVCSATLVVVMYIDRLPARLREKQLALQAEENEWAGKL